MQVDRFGGQMVQPQTDRFGGIIEQPVVPPAQGPSMRDFSSIGGPRPMPPLSQERLQQGFDYVPSQPQPQVPAPSHEEGEAYTAPNPYAGTAWEGKITPMPKLPPPHEEAQGPLENAAAGMLHTIMDLDPETLLARMAGNTQATKEHAEKMAAVERGTKKPGKGLVNELAYGVGASAPTMALGAGGAAGVAGRLAKGAMFAIPPALQTEADVTSEALQETGDPAKAVKEGVIRGGTNFAIFTLMGPLSEMLGGPEAANVVRQSAATVAKGAVKSGVELGTASVADHIIGEVVKELVRRDKNLDPELLREMLTNPERWKERAKVFGSGAITGGAIHAVSGGGKYLAERGAEPRPKPRPSEAEIEGMSEAQLAEKFPDLVKEGKARTPEEVKAAEEAVRRQAKTADLEQQVNEPSRKGPERETLTKEQVKGMAGEGVDQEALDQLLRDEPHVKVEVTPEDFNDIPRQNIDLERVQKYAAMPGEKAPPILAAANPEGDLRIADGRHRLLAAALREKQAGRNPNKAKVVAVVPESWAREHGKMPGQGMKAFRDLLGKGADVGVAQVPGAHRVTTVRLPGSPIDSGVALARMKSPNNVRIDAIYVPPKSRGKGLASKALQHVMNAADRAGITLGLKPVPLGDGGMTTEQLRAWYAKHGFEDAGGNVMVRFPKKAPAAAPKRAANEEVRTQAAEYVKQAGLPEMPKPSNVRVDVERAQRIADAYSLATHSPNDPKVKAAYDAFKKETLDQWNFLKSKGVVMEPWTKEGQPYKNSAEMQADVAKNRHLYFFQGGEIPADHPLASKVPGSDLTYNDVFRAVHDYFGHAKEGNQFGPRGEENAWVAHSVMYSPEARKAMTTETRGQNSWVNFGPKGEANRANPANTQYAEQKAAILPEEFHTPDSGSKLPPVKEQAESMLAQARKAQGGPASPPTIKEAMGAAASGSYAGSKLGQAVTTLIGNAKNVASDAASSVVSAFSRSAMPKLTALGRKAADLGVRYASAHIAAQPLAKAAVAEVLPKRYKDEGFRIKLGAVLVEGRLQALRQKFLANGDTASAAQVGTLIGSVGSPFKTDAEYRIMRADPEIQDAIARHKAVVQQSAENIHTELGGKLDVLDEDGAFVNLKALDPMDPQDKRQMPTSTRRGNLRNPRLQKSAFAGKAEGNADAYTLDYQKIVENTVGRNIERVAKKRFVEKLVDSGLAKILTPAQASEFNTTTFERYPDFNGRRAARIEGVVDYAYVNQEGRAVQVKKDLYVDPRIEAELRSAFNVDSPLFQKTGLNVLPQLLTHIQIAGPVDFVYHTARIFAQIANSPGGKSFVRDLGRKIPGVNLLDAVARIGANIGKVIQDTPEIRARIAHLAEIGALRGESKGLLALVDKAGRLALDTMYDNLVSRNLVKDTEAGRRDFSNQVGRYNSRLQTRVVRELKSAGLSPFITAGLSGNVEGIKAMAGSPVARGKTRAATAQLWATQVAGHVLSLVVVPALVNYLTTGKVTGRDGIPIGAIDTGKDDELGKHIWIDPLKWTGVRRGMRVTGIGAFLERKRTGGSNAEALDDSARAVLQGWTHPFAGPAVNAGVIATTGHDPSGFREAPVVQPGQSQAKANVKAALRQANPTIEAFLEGKREGGYGTGMMNTVHSLGSAVGIGSSKFVKEAAKHGAEVNEFRDDLKRRAKKVPRGMRMDFIRDEIRGLPGRDKARIYMDIQEHPMSWMGR